MCRAKHFVSRDSPSWTIIARSSTELHVPTFLAIRFSDNHNYEKQTQSQNKHQDGCCFGVVDDRGFVTSVFLIGRAISHSIEMESMIFRFRL